MKCLVCGTLHEAAECPRCHFPDIQIMGDQEKAMETLRPTIHAYRMDLLRSVQIALPAYRWKDHNGMIVADRRDWLSLGSGDALLEQEAWLPDRFARIAGPSELDVTVRITVGEKNYEQNIRLPNLPEPELQQIGAVIDRDCTLRLLLRNETRDPVSSCAVPLFS